MENKEKFISLCKQVARPGMDELLTWLEKSDFYVAPASSRFHGSYPGGLLEHSLNVYDEFQRLRKAYPEVNVSDEAAIICSLLHDLCKVNMYKAEKRNRKNEAGQWESYDAYTITEKFHFGGHGSKSVFIAQQFIKLTPEEAVAINCHMGLGDGKDHIGDAYEQYPIAFLLHIADEAATFIIEKKG